MNKIKICEDAEVDSDTEELSTEMKILSLQMQKLILET